MSANNIKLILEYNGSGFHGWQIQPGLRTIQSELTRIIQMVLRVEKVNLTAAGRTDAGVHARGQVVNFFIEKPENELPDLRSLAHSISNLLKGEVSVVGASYEPMEFDSRFSPHVKQYSYKLLWRDTPAVLDHGLAWRISTKIDLDKMREGASALIGTHDFSSLRGNGCCAKSPVREIVESEIIEESSYLVYRVVGRGFLKQMVRNIVGTLVDLGKDRLPLKSMQSILEARDRRVAGITAPPYGLYMDWVRYE